MPSADGDNKHNQRILIRWALLIAAALFVGLTMVGPGHALKNGTVGPPLALITPDGAPVDLRAYANKPLLLNFFATWCQPCRAEIPQLNRAHETMPGLNIAGVLVFSGTPEDARRELQHWGIKYPVWVSDDVTAARWKVEAVPVSYLMDPSGTIRWSAQGGVDTEDIRSAVAALH